MKKYLLTGLILLLPLALTIAIIAFVVNFLTKPFMGIVSHFLKQTPLANEGFLIFSPDQMLEFSSQLIILICLFLVILFIGMIARWYFVHWFIQVSEQILHRLPLVNKVYKASKEIINSFLGHGKNSFKQVVMVPFPGDGIYCLGLLSKEAPQECSENAKTRLFSVFIPTAPNPTTGFTVMFKECDIFYMEMKPEDAIKYIVSCGTVTPPETHHGTDPQKGEGFSET